MGNNPITYTDPDGRSEYNYYELNKNQQVKFLAKVGKDLKARSWISTFANVGSFLGNIPSPLTGIAGNAFAITSNSISVDSQGFSNILELYNETGFEAAKEYAKTTHGDFDKDCFMALNFAAVNEKVSTMNEPTTVLKKFQDNPGKRLSPKDMTEIRTSYYVTVMWQYKNGGTLGGTQIEVDKSTFYKLQKYTQEVLNE